MGIIEKSLLRHEYIIKKAIGSINHRLPTADFFYLHQKLFR